MTNADKFQQVFGIYATELWAKPEKEFLEWLNASAEPEIIRCKDCKWYGRKDTYKDGSTMIVCKKGE